MAEEEKKKKGCAGKIVTLALLTIAYFIVALVVSGFLAGKRDLSEIIDINNITSQYFLIIFGGLFLFTALGWLT